MAQIGLLVIGKVLVGDEQPPHPILHGEQVRSMKMKVLKTAAIIVGAVALVATALGALGPALGISAKAVKTLQTIGTLAATSAANCSPLVLLDYSP